MASIALCTAGRLRGAAAVAGTIMSSTTIANVREGM